MKTLLIDTSNNQEIKVGIRIDGKEDIIQKNIGENRDQMVLPLIVEILRRNTLNLKDINKIEVQTGPGSFTGLRVGVTIANALSYALQIPINDKKVGEFVEPRYE